MTEIRRGSPFAVNTATLPAELLATDSSTAGSPFASPPQSSLTQPLQWGVLQAAIWASAVVLLFSIACYLFFPGGGALVTALGTGLAIVGLFSSRPLVATIFLAAHAGLFFACYLQIMSN